MQAVLEPIRKVAAKNGLNLIATTSAQRYDAAVTESYRIEAIDPRARSIIVIGNGGGAFWQSFQKHAAENPGWMTRDNPLDDFTRVVIERDIAPLVKSATVVYPFMSSGPTLNFMAAGKAAGLAGPSIIGVMVNPTYGPWIAFRAAMLLEESIDASGEASGFDPCPSCSARSCISACPAEAVSLAKGWDIPKCLTHRVEVEADCAPRCHARAGCVLGPQHRYPDDELAYHQMRALRSMRPYYEAHIKPQKS